MKSTLPRLLQARRWPAAWCIAAAALLAACGGGSGVDTGGTGAPANSFSSGRISGFGSIIVNGVRFDDSLALVRDDEGNLHVRDDLKLGMVVDVDGGEITTDSGGAAASKAVQIQFFSEIKGPVESIDVAGGKAMVLGQVVNVDADTVFEGIANGLAGLQAGNTVEVFAFFDSATGSYTATRIEKEGTLAAYKLHGPVSELDTAGTTFMIGGAKVHYGGIPASQLPALANGQLVRVSLQTTPHAGAWVATKVSGAARHLPEQTHSEVEGYITDFASAASFKVDGVTVDASSTSVNFRNGSVTQLAKGVRVEVGGTVVNGVLVATKIEVHASHGGGGGGGGGHGHGDVEIELHGTIDTVAADARSFSLRGVTVRIDANTQFKGGTAANLIAKAPVEVKGNLIEGSSDVLATSIEFHGR